jgi:hypothetical protein
MESKAIKFVVVNPEGKICNPTADRRDELISVLEAGHFRAGMSGDWKDIEKEGFKIRRAFVEIID